MSLFTDSIRELCRAERVPQSSGYFHSQNFIQDQLQSFGLNVYRHKFNNLKFGSGLNVYAENQCQSGPRLLIGAHYESKKSSGPAADDNASGVAMTLELARRLSSLNRPLSFVFFDMEENFGFGGIKGSKAFLKEYQKPIEAVLIFDLIGGSLLPNMEKDYFQFGTATGALQHSDLNFLHLPIRFLEPFGKILPRSDYSPFRNKGIPFSFISSGTPWYYHTEEDQPERIRWQKMENLADTLEMSLRFPSPTHIPKWSAFEDFQNKILQIPELKKGIQKIRFSSPPSSWQLIKLYKSILPQLRQHGIELWSSLPAS